ncbi:MAG: FG-GAP-like repeat-containing protein [bacterium]
MTDPGATSGCSLVDFDLDGDLDLYFTVWNVYDGRDSHDRVLRNDGGTFRHAYPELESPDAHLASAWGDFDGDGDLDVYVVGVTNRLFRNDAGTFVDVTAPPLTVGADGGAPTWIDFDRDGDLDLVAAYNAPGVVRFFRNDGPGRFTDVTPPFLETYVGGVQSIAWGDWDNDGDSDPYLVRTPSSTSDGANFLLRNDGGGTFVDVTVPPLDDRGFGHGGVWADVDNDGDLDLYVTNIFGPNRFFRNDGEGGFVDASEGDLGDPANCSGVAFGDFDNDGRIDLYFCEASGSNKLLHNDCTPTRISFKSIAQPPLTDGGVGIGVAFGDVDGDGDLDLALANVDEFHANRLFRNDNLGLGHWLQIDLVGTVSNRFGVGARIVTEEGAVRQMREISAGEGLSSQEPFTAHFGLGPDPGMSVDRVTVRWPSGIVQTVEGLPVDRRIVITEESSTPAPIPGPFAGAFRLAPPFPNPFRDETELRFNLPAAGPVAISIFSVAGRKIRDVRIDGLGAGPNRWVWDGRDDVGGPATAGIYFVRLVASDGVLADKLVRVRR